MKREGPSSGGLGRLIYYDAITSGHVSLLLVYERQWGMDYDRVVM